MKKEIFFKNFSHIDQLDRDILFDLAAPDVMDIDSAKLRLELSQKKSTALRAVRVKGKREKEYFNPF
jgi:hypothetical protein